MTLWVQLPPVNNAACLILPQITLQLTHSSIYNYVSVKHVKTLLCLLFFFFLWRCGPTRSMASSFLTFLDHTQRRITVGRTPLDEWSARRRDLYLTTHNTQTSMPPVGFEPTISAGERPQTYALDRAATGTGHVYISLTNFGADTNSKF